MFHSTSAKLPFTLQRHFSIFQLSSFSSNFFFSLHIKSVLFSQSRRRPRARALLAQPPPALMAVVQSSSAAAGPLKGLDNESEQQQQPAAAAATSSSSNQALRLHFLLSGRKGLVELVLSAAPYITVLNANNLEFI